MPQKPLKVTRATLPEILGLGQTDQWSFDEEAFDGTWWRFEVEPDEVDSLIKGFRRQAARLTGRKSASRRKDGFVFLRVTEKEWKGSRL